jgi:hypothetical protein
LGKVKGSMFEHMAAPERIQAAKVKTERVVDHLLYLLALHENNAIIVYSNARFGTERRKLRRISQRLRS